MTIEAEFEKQLSARKMSDSKIMELIKTYHQRIIDSDFAQNTKFCKMSHINMVVKKLYPHLYTEAVKVNVPDRQEKKSAIAERNKFNLQRLENRQEFSYSEIMNDIDTLKKSE